MRDGGDETWECQVCIKRTPKYERPIRHAPSCLAAPRVGCRCGCNAEKGER
jgi:hypothetical protein